MVRSQRRRSKPTRFVPGGKAVSPSSSAAEENDENQSPRDIEEGVPSKLGAENTLTHAFNATGVARASDSALETPHRDDEEEIESNVPGQPSATGIGGASNGLDEGTSLFHVLLAPGRLTFDVVSSFTSKYVENAEIVGAEMCNFMFHCFGFPSPVMGPEVEYEELSAQVFLDEQHELITSSSSDERLANPYGGKQKMKHFPSNFRLFWHHFAKACAACESWAGTDEEGDDEDEASLLLHAMQWLTEVSGHPERRYRIVATAAALHLITGLTKFLVVQSSHQEKVAVQVTVAKNKKNAKNAASKKRLADLERMLHTIDTKIANLQSTIKDLFDNVYIHRKRDVSNEIRVLASELCTEWYSTMPSEFVRDGRLQHMRVSFHDRTPKVRLNSLKMCQALYKESKTSMSNEDKEIITKFTQAIFPHITNMCKDDEQKVAVEAMKTLAIIIRQAYREGGNFEEIISEDAEIEAFGTLSRLIFAEQPDVRRSVAKVVWLLENPNDREEDDDAEDIAPIELKKRQLEMFFDFFAGGDKNLDEMTQEEREAYLEECKRDGVDPENDSSHIFNVGPARAPHLVDAFWGLPECLIVRDIEFLANMLLSDDDGLTEQQTQVLVGIFSEVIRRFGGHKTINDDAHMQPLADRESALLMKFLPGLLSRYQHDERKIALLGALPQYLNLEHAATNRGAKQFTELLSQMHVLYVQHGAGTKLAEEEGEESRAVPASSLANLRESADDEGHTYEMSPVIKNFLENHSLRGKNVLAVLARAIAHLVGPSHLQRAAQTSLRNICDEISAAIEKNMPALETNEDGNHDDEEGLFTLVLHLERMSALYSQIDLIEHVSPEFFDSLNSALMSLTRDGISAHAGDAAIVRSCLRLLYSRIQFSLFPLYQRAMVKTDADGGRTNNKAQKGGKRGSKEGSAASANDPVEDASAEAGAEAVELAAPVVSNPPIRPEEFEPVISMREELVPYLLDIMQFEGPTTNEQWSVVVEAFNLFCDLSLLFKETLRTRKTVLYGLGWIPGKDVPFALAQCFERLIEYRASEGYTQNSNGNDAIEDYVNKLDIHQHDILRNVVAPYCKYAIRGLPQSCDVYATATLLLATRAGLSGEGYNKDVVNAVITKVKKTENGFSTFFDIQKTALMRLYKDTMEIDNVPARNKKAVEFCAFAKKLANKLKFGLKTQFHRNCVASFVSDGLLFALDQPENAHYVGALKPYLLLLKPKGCERIHANILESSRRRRFTEPWLDDPEFEDKFRFVKDFQATMVSKTGKELSYAEIVQPQVVPASDANVEAETATLVRGNDSLVQVPPPQRGEPVDLTGPNDISNIGYVSSSDDGKNSDGVETRNAKESRKENAPPAVRQAAAKKRKRESMNLSDGLSDLSSSDSENDFESGRSPVKVAKRSPGEGSYRISSDSDDSDAQSGQSFNERRPEMKNYRRRTIEKNRRRHRPSEVSIPEVDEDEDMSDDSDDDDFFTREASRMIE